MKIEISKVYTFHEGDVIASTMYNWVAVKVAGNSGWKHSNQEDLDIGHYFSDAYVEQVLENGTWTYMGNRDKDNR